MSNPNIREIILQEIEREGVKRFATAWGFTEKQVAMVQRTKKPSAAMLEKAFEFMQQSQDSEQEKQPPAEQPQPRQRRQVPQPVREPRPQPFRRAPGIAPMFTDPTGEDHPVSTVRPGVLQQPAPLGAPFIVPPNSMPGFVPVRHPGIALGSQEQLHQPQFADMQGMVVPSGVNPQVWMMFLQFASMMGMEVSGATREMTLPGGNVMESMEDPGYGRNWNIPYGKKAAPAAQQQQQRSRK